MSRSSSSGSDSGQAVRRSSHPRRGGDAARRVADAVLYEGYVLYPYRASAQKNRMRWQLGVVAPPGENVDEPSFTQTECLLQTTAQTKIDVTVRFLQVQRRQAEALVDGSAYQPVAELEVDGQPCASWDEAVEREVTTGALAVEKLRSGERHLPFEVEGGSETEPVVDAGGELTGRLVRTRSPGAGVIRVAAVPLDNERGLVKLRVVVENRTDWQAGDAPREEMLRSSLISCHAIVTASEEAFVSLLDPPDWAAPAGKSCENLHTYPVLVGEEGARDVVLSSPIILYDYPETAPESAGDSFDATEIDELLSLMVHSLTDEEKRAARATDARAAEIIDRNDTLSAPVMDRLHGAMRSFEGPADTADPGDAVDPALADLLGIGEEPIERLDLGDLQITVGARVRLRPSRRADAQDMFAAGKLARVEKIVADVDGETHLAVTLDDDPGADLHQWFGRFLYFHPDEVELADVED